LSKLLVSTDKLISGYEFARTIWYAVKKDSSVNKYMRVRANEKVTRLGKLLDGIRLELDRYTVILLFNHEPEKNTSYVLSVLDICDMLLKADVSLRVEILLDIGRYEVPLSVLDYELVFGNKKEKNNLEWDDDND